MMRCLSIADAAVSAGWHCRFFTADDSFAGTVRSRGYGQQAFHTDYTDMQQECSPFFAVIKASRPAAVFVDSYYVTASYLTALSACLKPFGGRLYYIDDVLSFAYPADCLINYNIYGPDKEDAYRQLYQKAGQKCPRLALGTLYAPLHVQYQGLPKRVVKETAKSILISTGGADPGHIGIRLAEYIVRSQDVSGPKGRIGDFEFHFVVGAMNQDREKLANIAALRDGKNITLHYNTSNMSGLMQRSDLAISAAGSTLYELCATQTPTVTYIWADNQIPGAEGFVKHGVMECAGDIRSMPDYPPKLLTAALELAGDYKRRVQIANRQQEVVDGKGAERIVEELVEI